jgi:hypothetical protein
LSKRLPLDDELCFFKGGEERVQGLPGDTILILEEEEDTSDDIQEQRAKFSDKETSFGVGLVRCSLNTIKEKPEEESGLSREVIKPVEESDIHIDQRITVNEEGKNLGVGMMSYSLSDIGEKPELEKVVADYALEENQGEIKDGMEGNRGDGKSVIKNVDCSKGIEAVLIGKKQKLLEGGQSARIQDHLIKKYQPNAQREGKKRSLEGNANNLNSFLFLIMMKLLP